MNLNRFSALCIFCIICAFSTVFCLVWFDPVFHPDGESIAFQEYLFIINNYEIPDEVLAEAESFICPYGKLNVVVDYLTSHMIKLANGTFSSDLNTIDIILNGNMTIIADNIINCYFSGNGNVSILTLNMTYCYFDDNVNCIILGNSNNVYVGNNIFYTLTLQDSDNTIVLYKNYVKILPILFSEGGQ